MLTRFLNPVEWAPEGEKRFSLRLIGVSNMKYLIALPVGLAIAFAVMVAINYGSIMAVGL